MTHSILYKICYVWMHSCTNTVYSSLQYLLVSWPSSWEPIQSNLTLKCFEFQFISNFQHCSLPLGDKLFDANLCAGHALFKNVFFRSHLQTCTMRTSRCEWSAFFTVNLHIYNTNTQFLSVRHYFTTLMLMKHINHKHWMKMVLEKAFH